MPSLLYVKYIYSHLFNAARSRFKWTPTHTQTERKNHCSHFRWNEEKRIWNKSHIKPIFPNSPARPPPSPSCAHSWSSDFRFRPNKLSFVESRFGISWREVNGGKMHINLPREPIAEEWERERQWEIHHQARELRHYSNNSTNDNEYKPEWTSTGNIHSRLGESGKTVAKFPKENMENSQKANTIHNTKSIAYNIRDKMGSNSTSSSHMNQTHGIMVVRTVPPFFFFSLHILFIFIYSLVFLLFNWQQQSLSAECTSSYTPTREAPHYEELSFQL